eukprot:COSAG02_NODE_795_length_17133_cov_6.577727_21_plen_204_part_00
MAVHAVPVHATPIQATPVVAQAIVASPLPASQGTSSSRTSNPLSIGTARIAPSSAASPVVASAMPAGESAEVGVAATFEVEDDFDDPDDDSFSTSTLAAPAAASSYLAPQSKLYEFLAANQLEKFEEQLRTLGAVDVPDLRELGEVGASFRIPRSPNILQLHFVGVCLPRLFSVLPNQPGQSVASLSLRPGVVSRRRIWWGWA